PPLAIILRQSCYPTSNCHLEIFKRSDMTCFLRQIIILHQIVILSTFVALSVNSAKDPHFAAKITESFVVTIPNISLKIQFTLQTNLINKLLLKMSDM